MRYPGYIMRQSLVDEMQKRVAVLKQEADKTFDLMNVKGLDQDSVNTLYEKYASLLGEIKAMRDLNEWAKEHTAPRMT